MAKRKPTEAQMRMKAAALIQKLHEYHVLITTGDLGAHDLALINSLVNAETHLRVNCPAAAPKKK